jgi:cytochrome c oxidase assembly factor CtaG
VKQDGQGNTGTVVSDLEGCEVSSTDATSGAAAGPAGGRWRTGTRRWLAVAALILAAACLVPPISSLAGRYVVAETAQFVVFAMITPALLVLAAPWPLLGLGGTAGQLARSRLRHPSFTRSAGFLAIFAVTAAFWRLPTVIDAAARHHALALAELASLLAAGTALWLELVPSLPLRPRGRGLQVAALAACAMWIIWIIAYILGMATHGVFLAFRYLPGGPLSAVADQELATAVLWAAAGVCFMPVIFLSALRGLHDDDDADSELERVASRTTPPPVRGWGRPRRGRARSI